MSTSPNDPPIACLRYIADQVCESERDAASVNSIADWLQHGCVLQSDVLHGAMYAWPRPIPVTERLPADRHEMVLAFTGEIWVMVLWNGEVWTDDDPHMRVEYSRDEFTHWLPLPLAPAPSRPPGSCEIRWNDA